MPVRLRADAERNRVALLAAARTVFGEQGLDGSLDEIARRAGVGNATLYRRFPSRQVLITEVFADQMHEYVALAEDALAERDPWGAFTAYVTRLCEIQAADRGMAELLVTTSFDGDERLSRLRGTAQGKAREVIARAQRDGRLRDDFRRADLVLLLQANAGVLARGGDWRRLLAYVLEGLSVTFRDDVKKVKDPHDA